MTRYGRVEPFPIGPGAVEHCARVGDESARRVVAAPFTLDDQLHAALGQLVGAKPHAFGHRQHATASREEREHAPTCKRQEAHLVSRDVLDEGPLI